MTNTSWMQPGRWKQRPTEAHPARRFSSRLVEMSCITSVDIRSLDSCMPILKHCFYYNSRFQRMRAPSAHVRRKTEDDLIDKTAHSFRVCSRQRVPVTSADTAAADTGSGRCDVIVGWSTVFVIHGIAVRTLNRNQFRFDNNCSA